MSDVPEIIEYAERPRVEDWSLRGALVRYAQPEPARAGAVLELVRRTDGALKPHHKRLERNPQLLSIAAADDGAMSDLEDDEREAVSLLAVARVLDELGDVLARWAAARSDDRPDAEVDGLARRAFAMLADLGVARETRPPRRAG